MATREISYKLKKYNISYEIINNNAKKTILILHGWGANKAIMKKAFGQFLDDFCHIYVDLPGFGSSDISTALNSKDYAKIIKKFLESICKNPKIIMGHSFGGKIATLLNPDCLVLLSSAGIVPKKPFFVRIKILVFKIFKFFGFGKLYSIFASKDVKGMSPVMYETLKKVVNEDFRDIFRKFDKKAYIFWGKEDKATPVKSGEIINFCIDGSEFYPLSGDHFFFLLHAKEICETISQYEYEDDV